MTTAIIACVTWSAAFTLGFMAGRYCERHKEQLMDLADRARHWYDRWAPMFVMVVGVLALIGIWIGVAATWTNVEQDRRADAATAERQRGFATVLTCFDEYAAATSTANVAVREALVVKDKASAARDLALRDLVRALKADDHAATADIFDRLKVTSDRLVRTQEALDRARQENPVPPPPSDFCEVKP